VFLTKFIKRTNLFVFFYFTCFIIGLFINFNALIKDLKE